MARSAPGSSRASIVEATRARDPRRPPQSRDDADEHRVDLRLDALGEFRMSRYLDWCIEQEGFRSAEEIMMESSEPPTLDSKVRSISLEFVSSALKRGPHQKRDLASRNGTEFSTDEL